MVEIATVDGFAGRQRPSRYLGAADEQLQRHRSHLHERRAGAVELICRPPCRTGRHFGRRRRGRRRRRCDPRVVTLSRPPSSTVHRRLRDVGRHGEFRQRQRDYHCKLLEICVFTAKPKGRTPRCTPQCREACRRPAGRGSLPLVPNAGRGLDLRVCGRTRSGNAVAVTLPAM